MVWWRLVVLICSYVLGSEINPLPTVVLYEGENGTFTCSSSTQINVQWLVNGSLLEDLDLGSVTRIETFSVGGTLTFVTVPLHYNGTDVQCEATFTNSEDTTQSNVAMLLVQGLLDAVFGLRVDYVSPSFVISWQPPFTLDIPGPINITYCILITNVSSSSPSPLENLCGIVPATYSVNLNFDPCVEYNVMITPENLLGNGTSTTAAFPKPGGVEADSVIAAASSSGSTVFEIQLREATCACQVTVAENAVECTLIGSILTFSVGRSLRNRFLTSTVTLHNGRQLTSTSSLRISTHDVLEITVSSTSPNTVELSARFVRESSALGVLFVLLKVEGTGGVDFDRSVFLVLGEAVANGFVQGSISQGNYTILAFDVEDDGRVETRPGQLSPAAVENLVVPGQDLPGQFPYSMMEGVYNCNVQPGADFLSVSCGFNVSLVMGYSVIVQYPGTLDLLIKESMEPSSPLMFAGLASGEHSVTVFPLTAANGIIGSTVAFTEVVNIVPITSTTAPSLGTTSPSTGSMPTDITTPTSTSSSMPGSPPWRGNSQTDIIVAVVVVVACMLGV